MLVMLTPGLACVMAMCAQEAQAAEASSVPPCHEVATKSSDHNGKGVMLMGDCSGADLAQAHDGVTLQKPDLQFAKILYPQAALPSIAAFEPAHAYQNRGPPPEWRQMAQTTPPLLLTTARIRI